MLRELVAVAGEDGQRTAALSCGHQAAAHPDARVGSSVDCRACDELRMPEHFVAYKETPVFTEQNVPAALLRDHSTKRGVWAQILVRQGQLGYRIDALQRQWTLEPGTPGIIPAEILHAVSLQGPVSFSVRFFRDPPL